MCTRTGYELYELLFYSATSTVDNLLASYIPIDNHDSGYLGMAVQLYVQAHLGHYHIPQPIYPQAHTLNTRSYVQELYMHLNKHRFTVLDW